MGRWMAGFFILFVFMSTLSGMLAGGDGYAITTLSAGINSSANVVTVPTTAGFLTANSIFWIDTEQLGYTGSTANSFTGVTRAQGGTTAAAHALGAKVYTDDASAASYAMGFDIPKTVAKSGIFSVISVAAGLFTITLPRIMQFNFVFLQGDLWMIGILFYGSFIGMLLTISISSLSGATTILRL